MYNLISKLYYINEFLACKNTRIPFFFNKNQQFPLLFFQFSIKNCIFAFLLQKRLFGQALDSKPRFLN